MRPHPQGRTSFPSPTVTDASVFPSTSFSLTYFASFEIMTIIRFLLALFCVLLMGAIPVMAAPNRILMRFGKRASMGLPIGHNLADYAPIEYIGLPYSLDNDF